MGCPAPFQFFLTGSGRRLLATEDKRDSLDQNFKTNIASKVALKPVWQTFTLSMRKMVLKGRIQAYGSGSSHLPSNSSLSGVNVSS